MSQEESLNSIVDDLLNKSVFSGTWHRLTTVPRIYRNRNIVAAVQGEILIEDRTVSVVVGFRDSFPLTIPLVFITPFDALGFIPHVDEDGFVCYVRGDGQFINYKNPAAIIKDALDRSSTTLTQGYRGENASDFTDGLAEYWGRIEGIVTEMSLVTPDESFRKIVQAATTADKKGKTAYFADNEQSIRALTFHLKKEKFITKTALYIPLEPTTSFKPPNYGKMWSLQDIQLLIQTHTSTVTKAEIRRETKKWKSVESVVFGLPRPSGGWVLFGIMFSGVQGAHPLQPASSVKKITPISLQRLDREYLMVRGGSNTNLRDKHVVVIGCGSVGGTIAFKLAQSGVGQLTLIDSDILTPENVFRHPVGYYRIGSKKVLALKTDLEMRVPYIQVTALPERIETLLQTKKFKWPDYNLVIIATGEPTINLYINELLHQQDYSPPTLFCWLDPYGIGGHTLLQFAEQPGCLQCLYEITESGHLNNRASFAEAGQSFLKDVAGCGSLFTPFGSLDVERTAQDAVRLALVALTTGAGNQVVSWKGDSTSFLSQG